MTDKIIAVENLLKEKNIEYTLVEHPAVYTIEEMMRLNLPHSEAVAKNLFLRDDKKRNYYIVTTREEKRTNLKELRARLGSRPLTFASEDDLGTMLGLIRGSVTPLGILNDSDKKVQVIIDKSFEGQLIGVHPNDNTATVWLRCDDLTKITADHGNNVIFVET